MTIIRIFGYKHKIGNFGFYGQYKDDSIIAYYLDRIGVAPLDTIYIELGVGYPERYSNTYWFYIRGGRGVLIDANPDVVPICEIVRPRDIFIQRAICGEHVGEMAPFYISGGASSLHNEWHNHPSFQGEQKIDRIISVKTEGINELLCRVYSMFPRIDFVSIDIEGEDKKVLEKWDFDKYRPSILCVEIRDSVIDNLMNNNGYTIIDKTDGNTIYIESSYIKEINK